MTAAVVGIALLTLGLLLAVEPLAALAAGATSRARRPRWRLIGGALAAAFGLALVFSAGPARAGAGVSETVRVPEASARWRLQVEQIAGDTFGPRASAARLAAQIHQESLWRPDVRSWAGAQGMAQFMPATGRWLAEKFRELGPYDPWDPEWSLRAAAVYDHWLLGRNRGDSACDSWAFALSAYNGGELHLRRERAAAEQPGRWFGAVDGERTRGAAAWRENRAYVARILTVLEPAYIAAGWSGAAVCA